MYNDKVIKIGRKPFSIDQVWYTGGNIYCYFGKFADGNYFLYGDCEEAVTIVDADPLVDDEEFGCVGFDPAWVEDHYVAATDMQFVITLLRKCQKECDKPGIEIWHEEINSRIVEQREHIKYMKSRGV